MYNSRAVLYNSAVCKTDISISITTGVGSGRGRGAAAPLNLDAGAATPTSLRQWVAETSCEIKLPAVIHSGMVQKRIESFFGEEQL